MMRQTKKYGDNGPAPGNGPPPPPPPKPPAKQHSSAPTGSALSEALAVAVEALVMYGNPESYHAISILCDPPYGEFGDDTDYVPNSNYDRPMPGKSARNALAEIRRIVSPNA